MDILNKDNEYKIVYKDYKTATGEEEGNITINLREYVDAYGEEIYHDEPTLIYQTKSEFVKTTIREHLNDKVFVSDKNLKAVIKDIDSNVAELLEELSSNENDD